ncbi:helix-turn-helix domain-containing protein [Natrarchaeobaculum sulfurireducens]|uniref:Transcriptional regulator, contains HTH domain n=1 Tax=Natrarchaeobaculum sulfurireducens TaxID=2044521 RepID=A0A346PEM1_9EURY|nr:helix-turn-helix domain-containing protein [Natrarchaeobaculum sulfurireducens]AXR77966.1 Transcriptional regulator, contains HTH domain [Natrarchaeobaculum sulfurireducens]
MAVDSADAVTDETETTPLRATLEVEPPPDTACVVIGESLNAVSVTRSCSGETCHSEVTVVEDGVFRQTYVSGDRTPACVCRTIGQFDCAFDIETVSDGALVIRLIVPDRSQLSQIVSELQRTGATVRLNRLSRHGEHDDVTIEVDATDVTEKQREAVELAVELGYYDRPREATLSDLAEALGISRSAVSQRLTAVELTLIDSFVDR